MSKVHKFVSAQSPRRPAAYAGTFGNVSMIQKQKKHISVTSKILLLFVVLPFGSLGVESHTEGAMAIKTIALSREGVATEPESHWEQPNAHWKHQNAIMKIHKDQLERHEGITRKTKGTTDQLGVIVPKPKLPS